MSTTVQTYFPQDLIALGDLPDGLIGLSLLPGRAPVLVVDYPGGSTEIGCPPALADLLAPADQVRALLADTSDRLDRLEERAADLADRVNADLAQPGPDTEPRTVPDLVAAALA